MRGRGLGFAMRVDGLKCRQNNGQQFFIFVGITRNSIMQTECYVKNSILARGFEKAQFFTFGFFIHVTTCSIVTGLLSLK